MYKLKEVEPFLARPTVYRAVAHICYWSAPWMKPTDVAANSPLVMHIHRQCPAYYHKHIPLVGKAPDGRNWTAIAGPYWEPFARDWASAWDSIMNTPLSNATAHVAGWILGDGDSLVNTLNAAGFNSSGHRDVAVVAKRVAAGCSQKPHASCGIYLFRIKNDSSSSHAKAYFLSTTAPAPWGASRYTAMRHRRGLHAASHTLSNC